WRRWASRQRSGEATCLYFRLPLRVQRRKNQSLQNRQSRRKRRLVSRKSSTLVLTLVEKGECLSLRQSLSCWERRALLRRLLLLLGRMTYRLFLDLQQRRRVRALGGGVRCPEWNTKWRV